jgi:hypothetical protein
MSSEGRLPSLWRVAHASMDASKDEVIAAFLLGLDTFSYQGAGRPLTW